MSFITIQFHLVNTSELDIPSFKWGAGCQIILVLKTGTGKEKQKHIFLALEKEWEQIQVIFKVSCCSALL